MEDQKAYMMMLEGRVASLEKALYNALNVLTLPKQNQHTKQRLASINDAQVKRIKALRSKPVAVSEYGNCYDNQIHVIKQVYATRLENGFTVPDEVFRVIEDSKSAPAYGAYIHNGRKMLKWFVGNTYCKYHIDNNELSVYGSTDSTIDIVSEFIVLIGRLFDDSSPCSLTDWMWKKWLRSDNKDETVILNDDVKLLFSLKRNVILVCHGVDRKLFHQLPEDECLGLASMYSYQLAQEKSA
jgi:hypothetical protein